MKRLARKKRVSDKDREVREQGSEEDVEGMEAME